MGEHHWSRGREEEYERIFRALVANGASVDEASDALQDAFEQALGRESSPSNPAGWLYVVALRRWRAARVRRKLFSRLGQHRAGPFETTSVTRIVLTEELAKLTRREREVVIARYVMGFSQEETASALGIAIGTVAATTHHATAKLKERLERDGL